MKTKEKSEKEIAIVDKTTDIAKFIKNSINLKPKKLKISDLKWKYLIRSVIRGKNIMITGPAGCGKTFAVQCIANIFPEREFFYLNLGSTQDPRATLIGNTHFNKSTGTFFAESYFVKAIQTENAIILLDELSRAHPEAMNILMTVLDENQRYLRLDEADGSPTIKVAKGVCFIATANIGNEYTATRVLDRALLDRFLIIEMDVLSAEEEKILLKEMFPELSDNKISAIAEIAEATRKEVKSDVPKISTIISTRTTIELAGLMNDGFSLAEAAEVAIFPFYPEEGGIDSERTYIKQLVQKYIDTDNNESLFNIDEEKNTINHNKKPF
jgi:MoxR-like ATPase